MAVVILGVLASLTSLAFVPQIQRNRLNAATEQVMSALVNAQQLAQSRSSPYVVEFDTVTAGSIPTAPVRFRYFDSAIPLADRNNQPWQTLDGGVYFVTDRPGTPAQSNFGEDGEQILQITFDENGTMSDSNGLEVNSRLSLALREAGMTNVARITVTTYLGALRQDCLVGGTTASDARGGSVGRC